MYILRLKLKYFLLILNENDYFVKKKDIESVKIWLKKFMFLIIILEVILKEI